MGKRKQQGIWGPMEVYVNVEEEKPDLFLQEVANVLGRQA